MSEFRHTVNTLLKNNVEKSKRLKQVRESLKWDQDKMAKELKLTRSYISEMENDRVPIQDWVMDHVENLASHPHVKLSEIQHSADDQSFSPAFLEVQELREILKKRTSALEKAKPQEQRTMLGVIAAAALELRKRIPLAVPLPNSAPRLSEDQEILKREGEKDEGHQTPPTRKK